MKGFIPEKCASLYRMYSISPFSRRVRTIATMVLLGCSLVSLEACSDHLRGVDLSSQAPSPSPKGSESQQVASNLGPYSFNSDEALTLLSPTMIKSVMPDNYQSKSPYLQFPYAVNIRDGEKNTILVSVNRNTDSILSTESFVTLRSEDGGKNWHVLQGGIPMSSVFQNNHGYAMSMNFRSYSESSEYSRSIQRWESDDSGSTWKGYVSHLYSNFPLKSAYFYRDIVESKNGEELIASVYGERKGYPHSQVWIARSRDKGVSWYLTETAMSEEKFGWSSSIPSGTEGFDEPSLARLKDGRLMLVARQSGPINPAVCRGRAEGLEVVSVFSSDDGRSWSEPDQMTDVGDGAAYMTADPQVLQTPQGLLLSVGRPETALLRPISGEIPLKISPGGVEWSKLSIFKPEVTSGYTSIVQVCPGEVIQFGDFGSNWCYPGDKMTIHQGIWMRKINIP